jgi:hypothetical protein
LLVDDDIRNLFAISHVLELNDIQVIKPQPDSTPEVHSGEEAAGQ